MNILPLLPDETIYSFLARLRVYSGGASHRNASLLWLGQYGLSLDQKLATHLAYFAEQTNLSSELLLNGHTYYPLFSLAGNDPKKLKEVMLIGPSYRLGNEAKISQSGLKALSNDKYCLSCIEADKSKYGVAYWHLSHQFTGIKSCQIHQTLLICTPPSSRVYRLPPQVILYHEEPARDLQQLFTTYVLKINESAKNKSRNDLLLDQSSLNTLIKQKGFMGKNSINMHCLLAAHSKVSELLFSMDIITEHVARNLIRKPNYPCHPLKLTLFRFALEQLPDRATQGDIQLQLTDKNKDKKRHKQCLVLLQKNELNFTEIARRVKCSVGYVIKLAKQENIGYLKRTQFISADIEKRILIRLIKGDARDVIAKAERVSISSVEKVCGESYQLSEWRQYLRALDKRSKYRNEMSTALKANCYSTRAEIKAMYPACYMWLYKYDAQWLYLQLPPASYLSK